MPAKIEISHRTIIFTILLLLSLWFVYYVLDILLLFFISYVLMTALRPLVEGLTRLRLPRILAVIIVYIIIFGIFGVSLAGTVPAVVDQFVKLLHELPVFVERLFPYWTFDARSLTDQITPISQGVVRVTVSIFSNIFSLLPIFGFTFYLLMERNDGEALITELFGAEAGERILVLVRIIEKKLQWWVQGELLLMCVIGILVYIGLLILRVDYALSLAILAGLLEIVPIIGPVVSAVPAVLVAWGTSQYLALPVIALYVIVQQIENNLVVPLVMRRSVGISPLLTLFALLIGNRFGGVMGALLSVPFVLVLEVFIADFLRQSGKTEKALPNQKVSVRKES